jgi:hypothetical protein
MRSVTVQNVNAIHGGEKTALEGLLGERLRDDEQVFIMVLSPDRQANEPRGPVGTCPGPEAGCHVANVGRSADDADEAVEEVAHAPNRTDDRELSLTGLVNVLLDLVDPEDVAAAVRLHSRRSNSAMLALVDRSEIPLEIDDGLQEERPW